MDRLINNNTTSRKNNSDNNTNSDDNNMQRMLEIASKLSKFTKEAEKSLSLMCVFCIFKDTSERVTRRRDDTVEKKRVNEFLCIEISLLEEVRQPTKLPKNPAMLSPTRY